MTPEEIVTLARSTFRTAVEGVTQSDAPTRAELRRFVAGLVDAGNEWLSKHDAQEASAAVEFAASQRAQFDTFVSRLPPVEIDPAKAEEEAPPAAKVTEEAKVR